MAQEPDVARAGSRARQAGRREAAIRRGVQRQENRQPRALEILDQAKDDAAQMGDTELIDVLAGIQVEVEDGNADAIERVLSLEQKKAFRTGSRERLDARQPSTDFPGPFDVGPRHIPGMRPRQEREGVSHDLQIAANALDWAALAMELPRAARGVYRFAAKRALPWIGKKAAATAVGGPGLSAGLTTMEGIALLRHLAGAGRRKALQELRKDVPLAMSRIGGTGLEVAGGLTRTAEGLTATSGGEHHAVDPVTTAFGLAQTAVAGLPGSGVLRMLREGYDPSIRGQLQLPPKPTPQLPVSPLDETPTTPQTPVTPVSQTDTKPPPLEKGDPGVAGTVTTPIKRRTRSRRTPDATQRVAASQPDTPPPTDPAAPPQDALRQRWEGLQQALRENPAAHQEVHERYRQLFQQHFPDQPLSRYDENFARLATGNQEEFEQAATFFDRLETQPVRQTGQNVTSKPLVSSPETPRDDPTRTSADDYEERLRQSLEQSRTPPQDLTQPLWTEEAETSARAAKVFLGKEVKPKNRASYRRYDPNKFRAFLKYMETGELGRLNPDEVPAMSKWWAEHQAAESGQFIEQQYTRVLDQDTPPLDLPFKEGDSIHPRESFVEEIKGEPYSEEWYRNLDEGAEAARDASVDFHYDVQEYESELRAVFPDISEAQLKANVEAYRAQDQRAHDFRERLWNNPATRDVLDKRPTVDAVAKGAAEYELRELAPDSKAWNAALEDDDRRTALLTALKERTGGKYSDEELLGVVQQSYTTPRSNAVDQVKAVDWIRAVLGGDLKKLDSSVSMGGRVAPLDQIIAPKFRTTEAPRPEEPTPGATTIIGEAPAAAKMITPEQQQAFRDAGHPVPGAGTGFEDAARMLEEAQRTKAPIPQDPKGGTVVTEAVQGTGETAGATPHTLNLGRIPESDPRRTPTPEGEAQLKAEKEFKDHYRSKGLTEHEINRYYADFYKRVLSQTKATMSGNVVPDVLPIQRWVKYWANEALESFRVPQSRQDFAAASRKLEEETGRPMAEFRGVSDRQTMASWMSNILSTDSGPSEIAVAKRALEFDLSMALQRVKIDPSGRTMFTQGEFSDLPSAYPIVGDAPLNQADLAAMRQGQQTQPDWDVSTLGGQKAKQYLDELFELESDDPTALYKNPVMNQMLRMQHAFNRISDQRAYIDIAFPANDPTLNVFRDQFQKAIDAANKNQAAFKDYFFKWKAQAATPVRPIARTDEATTPMGRIQQEIGARGRNVPHPETGQPTWSGEPYHQDAVIMRAIQGTRGAPETRSPRSNVQQQLTRPSEAQIAEDTILLEAGLPPREVAEGYWKPGELSAMGSGVRRTTPRILRKLDPQAGIPMPQADTFLDSLEEAARKLDDQLQETQRVAQGVIEVYSGIPSAEAISQMLTKFGAGSRTRGAASLGLGAMGAHGGYEGGKAQAEELNLTGPAAQILALGTALVGGTMTGATPHVLRGSYRPKPGFEGMSGFLKALSNTDNMVQSEIIPVVGKTLHNFLLSGASALKAATGANGGTMLEGLVDQMDGWFISGRAHFMGDQLTTAQKLAASKEAAEKTKRGRALFGDTLREWKNFWTNPKKSETWAALLFDPSTPAGEKKLFEFTGDKDFYRKGSSFLGEAMQTEGKPSAIMQAFLAADLPAIKNLRNAGRTLEEAQQVTLAGQPTSALGQTGVDLLSPTTGHQYRRENRAAQRRMEADVYKPGQVLGADIFDQVKRMIAPVPRISAHMAEGVSDAARRLFRGKHIPAESPIQDALRSSFTGSTPRDLANLGMDAAAIGAGVGTSDAGLGLDPSVAATLGLGAGKRVIPFAAGYGFGQASKNPTLPNLAKETANTVLDIVNPVTERFFRDPMAVLRERAIPGWSKLTSRVTSPGGEKNITPSAIDAAVRSGESPPWTANVPPSVLGILGTTVPQVRQKLPTYPPIYNRFTGERDYSRNPIDARQWGMFGGGPAQTFDELAAKAADLSARSAPPNAQGGAAGIGEALLALGGNIVKQGLQTPQSMFQPRPISADQEHILGQGQVAPGGGPLPGVPAPSTGRSVEARDQVHPETGLTVQQPPPIEMLQELRQIQGVLNEDPNNRMLLLEQLQYLRDEHPDIYNELRSSPEAYRRYLRGDEGTLPTHGLEFTMPSWATGGRP